jgi:predicted phosphodiesterase
MRIGVISDTHFPACHPAAIDFLMDIFEAWDIQRVVHIGDVSDLHGPSFHDHHPEMPGPLDEFIQARDCIRTLDALLHEAGWVSAKKPMLVTTGNHDLRPKRVAAVHGITDRFLYELSEVWETPDWKWDNEWELDGVLYTHGHKGCGGGKHPAMLTLEKGLDMPVVLGHYHTRSGISALAGRKTLRWGMNVGCLVDRLHPAMEYSESGSQKPIMACGVVIDGHPYIEYMACGPGEKYSREKFKKKKGR